MYRKPVELGLQGMHPARTAGMLGYDMGGIRRPLPGIGAASAKA
jgi:hypothetical protein